MKARAVEQGASAFWVNSSPASCDHHQAKPKTKILITIAAAQRHYLSQVCVVTFDSLPMWIDDDWWGRTECRSLLIHIQRRRRNKDEQVHFYSLKDELLAE